MCVCVHVYSVCIRPNMNCTRPSNEPSNTHTYTYAYIHYTCSLGDVRDVHCTLMLCVITKRIFSNIFFFLNNIIYIYNIFLCSVYVCGTTKFIVIATSASAAAAAADEIMHWPNDFPDSAKKARRTTGRVRLAILNRL